MATRQGQEDPPLRTIVSPGNAISGKLSFALPVKIDGRFSGEVSSSELLVLGPHAKVKAKIIARELQVQGNLVGEVHVSGWVEVLPGGHLQGELEAGRLEVHPGGVFEGRGMAG